MIGNDPFGRSDLLPSECERLFRDRAYGIDVVKINAFSSFTPGSTSRGTATSMMKSERSKRCHNIGASISMSATAFPMLLT